MNTIPRDLTCVLVAALLATALPALAAPGDLDATFGTGGRVTTAVGSGDDEAYSVAIQGDGKIVVAGMSRNGWPDFAIVRYMADGSLDPTFGGGGKVITPIGSLPDSGSGVVVQTDGKIVVVGSTTYSLTTGISSIALVRYLADGSLDPIFGGGGIVRTFIDTSASGTCVALQSDGKIVVAGNSTVDVHTYTFALARYSPNGALDSSFGNGGKVTTAVGYGSSRAGAVAIQNDGKIVVAGFAPNQNIDNDFALVRYTGDGTLDPGFGSGGKVLTAIGSDDDVVLGVALQGDGKIVAAGYSNVNGSNDDFALVRYTANGSLDPSFGIGGKVTTEFAGGSERGYDVTIQHDGKIVVAGDSYNGTVRRFAMARYSSNGSLDPTFGSGGKVFPPVGTNDRGRAIAIQSNGSIVVAGYSNPGSGGYDIAVMRFEGGPFTPLEQWKVTQLGSLNAPDLGDPEGDGLTTLAEYGLVLSPTAPSLPPPAERHLYTENERLRLFLTRDPARNDVTIAVQAADSLLGPWTAVATSTLGAPFAGPGYVGGDDATPGLKTVEVRDVVNFADAPQRFLRIKITH